MTSNVQKIKEIAANELKTRKVMSKSIKFASLKKFHEIILKTGRDCTVQRESVWRNIAGKQSKYMSAIAQGYSDTSTFHLINLSESVKYLEPLAKSSGIHKDLQFVDHVKTFITKGFDYIHIDGGNRSDTIIDWYDNKIALECGNYIIPVDDELTRYTLNKDNYYTYEVLVQEFPEFADFIDKQTINMIEYVGLNREERRDLFRRLNDNENLNTEELRNCSTSDICTWIRNLNYKYRDLFVKSNEKKTFVLESNAIRYKFCAYLASLNNYYAYQGVVDSFTPKTLDADYESNSIAEQSFKDFKKFFESTFVPFMKHVGDFSKIGGARNRVIDLYCAMVDIYKNGGELRRFKNNKLDYKSYLETYLELIGKYWGDEVTMYETGRSSCKFKDLYGANTNYKLKHRLDFLRGEFIPLLEERGLIVTKDRVRFFPSEWRRQLWSDQNGKCAISGKAISITDVENGDIVHIDHIVPHSKGGQTVYENAQLVLVEYNLEKSNKYDAA